MHLLHHRQPDPEDGPAHQHSPDYYPAIGKKGDTAVKHMHGPEYFSQIGKKGGNSLKAQREPDYYRRIGRLGGTAPRRSKGRNEVPPS